MTVSWQTDWVSVELQKLIGLTTNNKKSHGHFHLSQLQMTG